MLKLMALSCTLAFSFFSQISFSEGAARNGEEELISAFERGETVTGWVHAAVPKYRQYVFTWRNPQNFFESFEYPMIPGDDTLYPVFSELKRHDKIEVSGELFETSAGQRHLIAQSLKVTESYESDITIPPHEPVSPERLAELGQSDEAIFSVHAVLQEGKVVVLDYKDAILPLIVENADDTKGLFRYDIVRVRYLLELHPGRPQHLELLPNEPGKANVTILSRVTDGHDQPIEITGDLILFPKSPQIKFNIFAIRHIDQNGIKTVYTLVNFEDMALFEELRATLQNAWDASSVEAINDRNKLVKPGLVIQAKGTKNIVSPNQANPQILIDSLTQLIIRTP